MDCELKLDPPHRHAVDILCESGEVAYGKSIAWSRINELLGMNANDKNHPFEVMQMSSTLKELGFWASESGMNGEGLRIMGREEMATVAVRRLRQNASQQLKNSGMLAMVPREGLDDKYVNALNHAGAKCAVSAQATLTLIRQRKLPSPETIGQSIRQMCGDEQNL